MTKEEVFNYILVNTNQYFVGAENFEIKPPVLDGLLWKALNIWGDYNSVNVIEPIHIQNKIKIETITDKFGIKRIVKNIADIYVQDYTQLPFSDAKHTLKVPFSWKYNSISKILFSGFEGLYYIEALCTPVLDDIKSNETLFLELITGLALEYIGHNRNDFALSELPFDIRDLSDLGSEKVEKVKEELESSGGNWYEAIELLY